MGLTAPLSGSCASVASPSPAPAAPLHQIRVTLFGQPCALEGPFDESTLQFVHSISPEQVYPDATPSLATADGKAMKATLKKLQQRNAQLPAPLDTYRDRLSKRLEAQVAFLDSAENAKKSKKTQPLEKAVNEFARPSAREELLKKAKKGGVASAKLDSLFEAFQEAIEAEPEEDFHRAIQRMKVQYDCSFEGSEKAE